MALYSRQGSSRLGAGAASNADNNAGQAAPAAGSAPSSAVALGGLTAGTGQAGQRATGNIRRTAQGLGRRAGEAARSFYSTDDRYTRNPGWSAGDFAKPEEPKVYSNDPSQAGQAPVPLSQAAPAYVPPKPAPTPAPAVQAPQALVAPTPTPAVAPAPPVMNIATPKPAVQSPIDKPISNDLGTAPGASVAPVAISAPAYQDPFAIDTVPAPAPTRQLSSGPDVGGFLQAQKRILGR
jgi:hypothetical protein